VKDVKLFEHIESKVREMGGSTKGGLIAKWELEAAQEIRVSIRPTNHIGSIELFTLRELDHGDYYLMLIAIPMGQKDI
jgi:hypothetical protein